ncbi:MAG: TadE family protein [Planctomycetota bacterium]
MNKRSNTRTGATAVEFAIVAPVFFLIIMAMFEFSRVNVVRHSADNAAYEAARRAIVPGATAAEAIGEAERLLGIIGARGAVVSVDPPVLTVDTREVTVRVDLPLSQNALIVPRFVGNKTLRSQSTLRTERVDRS